MRWVYLIDLHRPRLSAALAARGMGCTAMASAPGARPDRRVAIAAIRHWWHGPLLMMLPAAATAADAVRALDSGADDAFPDTTDDPLIAARLAALLRWAGRGAPIICGPITIDPVARRVSRGGAAIALLPREYRLLLHLAERPGQVVSRAELLRAVCGLAFDPGTNVLDVHLSRLRTRIDRDFDVPLIRTEKGRGFYLAVPEHDASAPGERPIAVAAIAAAR